MTVSTMKLVKIGAIGGLITVTMGLVAQNKVRNKIKAEPYYKEAMHALRHHKGAVHYLGEPMKAKPIDVENREKNFIDENNVQLEIDVKGPKQKGTLYFWADRNENDWRVHRIELGLENEPDKRLLIRKIV